MTYTLSIAADREKSRDERDGHGNIDAIVTALGGGWHAWVGHPQGTAYATAFLSPWEFSVDDGTGTVHSPCNI